MSESTTNQSGGPDKLYVVTEDVPTLVEQWCKDRDFVPPDEGFYDLLRSHLRNALNEFGFAASGVRIKYVARDNWVFNHLRKPDDDDSFWISLDDVYVENADCYIDTTRIFSESGELLGIGQRPGTSEGLTSQLGHCSDKYREAKRPANVVLADDGTYTGGTIVEILKRLDVEEIHVTEIRLAFCTVESLEGGLKPFLKTRRPVERPITYGAGMIVDKEVSLLDWVCERDFYLGIPRSGRTAGAKDEHDQVHPFKQNIGHPYVLPFGNISDGARIDGNSTELSRRLTDYSIRLWQEIERLNDTKLTVSDFPRFPGPGDVDPYEEFCDDPLVEYLELQEKSRFGSRRREMRASNRWDLS